MEKREMSVLSESAENRPAAERLRMIDCDVHPYARSGIASLFPYMPSPWKERFLRNRAAVSAEARPLRFLHPNGAVSREDARPPDNSPPGSNPDYLIEDLLDRQSLDVAILNCIQAGSLCSALAGPDESIVLASAFNDLFIDEWLRADGRLRLAITVPSQDPLASAAEIRRVGEHPQVAAIALPLINVLLGNRYWWPIYEAAQDVNLPILMHVTGPDSIYHGVPIAAGGLPESYVERYVTLYQAAESSINSLVFSGTFERFPRLKFLFAEYGFLWVLPLLIRMDRMWRELRHDTPWVKKSPIDYVHQHCKFTTQPIDEPRNPRDLDTLIGMMGYDLLCFSTDYPHWDNDMPGTSLRALPKEARAKIFYDNATDVLRL
jgi:uncharacterized protein